MPGVSGNLRLHNSACVHTSDNVSACLDCELPDDEWVHIYMCQYFGNPTTITSGLGARQRTTNISMRQTRNHGHLKNKIVIGHSDVQKGNSSLLQALELASPKICRFLIVDHCQEHKTPQLTASTRGSKQRHNKHINTITNKYRQITEEKLKR